jgi:large subunit ribosomal protein L22e
LTNIVSTKRKAECTQCEPDNFDLNPLLNLSILENNKNENNIYMEWNKKLNIILVFLITTMKHNKAREEKKVNLHFGIDCTKPVEDKVFNTSNFAEFLRQRIKVDGKLGKLGDKIKVSTSEDRKITVDASIPFSKRYLKYLTKKYLKKHSLREFLYVVASDKKNYQIKYFNIQQDGGDDE